MTIGGNLKKLRVAQGLTQDQLAEKLHVTRQAVSNWERNVSHPDLDQLETIAAALGVEVTTLLYGPPQPYRPSRKRAGVTVGLAAAAVTAFAVCHGGLEPWLVQGYQRGYPGYGLLYELLFFGPVLGLLLGIAAGGVLICGSLDVGRARQRCLAGGVVCLLLPLALRLGTGVSRWMLLLWAHGGSAMGLLAGLAAGLLLFLAGNPGQGRRRLEKKKRSPAPGCAEDRFAVSQLVFTGGSG